ncbi:MAG: winged helix-turn-helix transcriptional regulator [Limnochordales bacterium]|nr:winged helix-turn-helix transcriptional regulator [Limnochordales bacterium]
MLADYEAVMNAAADSTRARILKMLQTGELCVCQIMAVLGMNSSTVSKHLAILKMAGLVRSRKEGRWVYYSLESRERNPYALSVLQMVQGWLDDDPDVIADRKKLKVVLATPLDKMCIQDGRVVLAEHQRVNGEAKL